MEQAQFYSDGEVALNLICSQAGIKPRDVIFWLHGMSTSALIPHSTVCGICFNMSRYFNCSMELTIQFVKEFSYGLSLIHI